LPRGLLCVIFATFAVVSVAEPDIEPLPPSGEALAAIDERPAVHEALAMQVAAESRARALGVGPHEFTLGGGWHERRVESEGDYNEWEAFVTRGVRLPGKAGIDRSLGEVEMEAAENGLADARHVEARRLLAAWFAWLTTGAEAKRDAELAKMLKRTVVAARRQAELGEISTMELELAEAEAARATAAATRSAVSAGQARRALLVAFPALSVPGHPPEAPAPVAPERPLVDWPAVILERSHEIRLAELDEQRARLTAERASKDRWPDPTVGLRVLDERGGAEEALGVIVSMPLPGRYRSALAAESRQKAAAALARVETMRREVVETADQDVAEAQAALTAWPSSEEAARQAARYLEKAQRAFELGEIGLPALLISVISASETIHEERMARLGAQEALARLRIDAHELWAPEHEHHDH
jgi:outer membrane protein TolC